MKLPSLRSYVYVFLIPLSGVTASLAFGAIRPEPESASPPKETVQDKTDMSETFPVVLEPVEHTQIFITDISTRAIKINKKMGDAFKKGDLLIQFDNDIYKANVENTKRAVEKAQLELKVREELYNDHIASPLEVKQAQSLLAKAQAEYAIAAHQLKETEIRAEYDGKVVAVGVQQWELPKRDKAIIELVSDKKLLATLFIPSSMLRAIRENSRLYIWIQELNEILEAKVTRIGAVINPASSTIKIEAAIDNSSGRLKSGMSGTASFSKSALTPYLNSQSSIQDIKP